MLACGIMWEYLLPYVYPRGTSDVYDVVAYIAGGITYTQLCKLTHKEEYYEKDCENSNCDSVNSINDIHVM